ncbi:MAG: ribonuclease HII [Verrucomicrobia bacterium]|nr:ribonuclease HII [Verrucomicrobiota bacterium]
MKDASAAVSAASRFTFHVSRPSYRFENAARRRGARIIAGVDEAGRGPLAGPVVAAAAILPQGFRLRGLNDSKQLSAERRDEFYAALTSDPSVQYAVGIVDEGWIDRINILRATERAAAEAINKLPVRPDHVLVDGRPMRGLPAPQTAIIKGDARSFSIAAASVIAKVTRDRLMLALHAQYPAYDFASNKGYPTPEHIAALRAHGPCPVHRRTFGPVREQFVQGEMRL